MREAPPKYKKRTEWHAFATAPRTSRGYILDFISKIFATPQLVAEEEYTLRPEQEAAVAQAITALGAGEGEVLWNAKPRYGKTLTAYDIMQTDERP